MPIVIPPSRQSTHHDESSLPSHMNMKDLYYLFFEAEGGAALHVGISSRPTDEYVGVTGQAVSTHSSLSPVVVVGSGADEGASYYQAPAYPKVDPPATN